MARYFRRRMTETSGGVSNPTRSQSMVDFGVLTEEEYYFKAGIHCRKTWISGTYKVYAVVVVQWKSAESATSNQRIEAESESDHVLYAGQYSTSNHSGGPPEGY